MKIENGYVVLYRASGNTGAMQVAGTYSTEAAALTYAQACARSNGCYDYFIATPSVVIRLKPTPVEVEEVRL